MGKAELAIVNYIDGRGDRKTQLIVVIDGGEQFWAFPKGTEEHMRPANEWLADQLRDQILGAGVAKARAELGSAKNESEPAVDVEPVDLPKASMAIDDDDEEE